MDFGKAILLIAFCYAITAVVAQMWPGMPKQLKPLVSMIVGVISVFVVAETVWAPENIVSGHSLDTLNGASKAVVGVLLGAGGVILDQGFKAVRNIGENQPPPSPS